MSASCAVCLGERRLPACPDRRPAGRNFPAGRLMATVFGKLPEKEGWRPAFPSKKTKTAPPRRGDR